MVFLCACEKIWRCLRLLTCHMLRKITIAVNTSSDIILDGCFVQKPAAARNGGVGNKPEGQNSSNQVPDAVLKFTDPVR